MNSSSPSRFPVNTFGGLSFISATFLVASFISTSVCFFPSAMSCSGSVGFFPKSASKKFCVAKEISGDV